ncbi:MAG: PaaI family thioesterase [Planctomycetota bacterium]
MFCGHVDRLELALSFSHAGADGVAASVRLGESHQGYPQIAHGGLVAALLDTAMTNCLFAIGVAGLTASLDIRYRAPVPLDVDLRLEASIQRSRGRLHSLIAALYRDSTVLADAAARFLEPQDHAVPWRAATARPE